MKKKIILIPLLFLFLNNFSQDIIGHWKTVSDKTNEINSIIKIYKVNNEYNAQIIAIPNRNNAICTDCKGKYHNKNIIGLVILKKLVKKGNIYDNGKIMDPENAKTYSCYLKLETDDKLKIRGYIGFSILGRTQYWYRLSKQEEVKMNKKLNVK